MFKAQLIRRLVFTNFQAPSLHSVGPAAFNAYAEPMSCLGKSYFCGSPMLDYQAKSRVVKVSSKKKQL